MLNRFWRILLLATLKDTPSVTPSGRMAFASPPPFYETTTMPSDAAPSAALLSRSYQSAAAAAAALAHACPSVRRPRPSIS